MKESYYILTHIVKQGEIFSKKHNTPDIAIDECYKGKSFGKINDPIQLFYQFKTNVKTDYIGGTHPLPVISHCFKEILLSQNTNYLEFYPVELICEKTMEVDRSYSFLNILENVPCFDWEKSEYRTFPTDKSIIVRVKHLFIKERNLQGRDLARIQEIPTFILISGKLRDQIEEAGLTGIKFQNFEDFEL